MTARTVAVADGRAGRRDRRVAPAAGVGPQRRSMAPGRTEAGAGAAADVSRPADRPHTAALTR